MRAPRLPDLAVLLLALCLATFARAAGFDLPALMQQLAQVHAGVANFVEDRQVAQLDQSMRSSGRLSFSAPDTFERETLRPRPERLAVVGNQLTITRGGRTRTALLDSVPEAAVIVEAVRGTLTGNAATLQRLFDTSVAGSPDDWQLDLLPREARMRAQVASIRVTGRGAAVREVRITMADGDTSVMHIEPVPGAPAARP